MRSSAERKRVSRTPELDMGDAFGCGVSAAAETTRNHTGAAQRGNDSATQPISCKTDAKHDNGEAGFVDVVKLDRCMCSNQGYFPRHHMRRPLFAVPAGPP